MSPPLMYKWDGEVMRPLPYFRKQAVAAFKEGDTYRLAETGLRSMQSHRHFFACVYEAWANLREDQAEHFPSADHLRKWALTFTQFCDVHTYHAASKAEAMRVMTFLAGGDTYSRIEIDGTTVTHYVPHSQAVAAMPDNRTFQASKSAVLDVLALKLGVSVEQIEAAARRAA